jgi:hypothetical protein
MNTADDHDRLTVLEAKHEAAEKARAVQAIEYARRLDELNHEHARVLERNADFVSRDKFEGHANTVNAKLAVLEGRDTGGKPLRDIGMLVVGAAIAFVVARMAT